jgi:hypothetical protein
MRQRLPLILSAAALTVAILGSTPLGHAALDAVPFAKKAGTANKATFATRAKTATNALRLNGRTASQTPRAGQIPVVLADGKLPASLGQFGPTGPQGAAGPQGPKGDAGAAGLSAVEVVTNPGSAAAGAFGGDTATCPTGKVVLGGGVASANVGVYATASQPVSTNAWSGRVYNSTGSSVSVTTYAVCAKP